MISKIKFIIIFLLLSVTANAQSLKYQFNHLTKPQVQVLKQACRAGIADNLCLTMAAIAWQESDFGLYQINLQDPSAGIFHIKISTAMSYTKLRNTGFNRNRVAMWLIRYPTWTTKIALSQLKFWLRYWHKNWLKAVGSYNGGYKWSRKYARKITNKVRFLKRHIKF